MGVKKEMRAGSLHMEKVVGTWKRAEKGGGVMEE